MDDPGGVDVDQGLDGPRSNRQHRVLVERLVGDGFGEGRAVYEFGGHPGLRCINVSGEELGGELAADPHAEFDFASEPAAKRRIRGQAGVDDFDGGEATVLVLAEVDGAESASTEANEQLVAADIGRVGFG